MDENHQQSHFCFKEVLYVRRSIIKHMDLLETFTCKPQHSANGPHRFMAHSAQNALSPAPKFPSLTALTLFESLKPSDF